MTHFLVPAICALIALGFIAKAILAGVHDSRAPAAATRWAYRR